MKSLGDSGSWRVGESLDAAALRMAEHNNVLHAQDLHANSSAAETP